MSCQTSIKIIDSDLDVFDLLQKLSFLTSRQISQYSGRHRNSVNRRLDKLAGGGFVKREQAKPTDEAIWYPGAPAITALVQAGRLGNHEQAVWSGKRARVKIEHKQHDTEVNDVLLALIEHADHHDGVRIDTILKGEAVKDRVYDRSGTAYAVHPDALVRLSVGQALYYFCLEIDRGTKPCRRAGRGAGTDIARQMFAYSVYYERCGFVKKYARGEVKHPHQCPFRVLVTAPDATRRNSMATTMVYEMLRQGKTRRDRPVGMFRGYAIFGDVLSDPYEALWLREVELAPILAWLETKVADRSLGDVLPSKEYGDVLEAMDSSLVEATYRSSRDNVKLGSLIRDGLIEALIATGRLKLYSLLENWPQSKVKRK